MNHLTTPRSCTRCHVHSALDRNSAGECTECHNLGYREYTERRRLWRESQLAKGRAYWQGRGMSVGQSVKMTVVSMLGFSAQEIHGIAKVGNVGAYVSSRFQRGYLQPHRWQAA